MSALVFLVIGVCCGLVARALLVTAAFKTSVWWGVGVFFPFGPLAFRLNYPEEARRARMFQLATLPCIFFYILLGHSPQFTRPYHQNLGLAQQAPVHPAAYQMELNPHPTSSPSKAIALPSIEERRTANALELERLRLWNEALRLRKRDILRSDVESTRVFNQDASAYNAALEKANAEKVALAPGAK